MPLSGRGPDWSIISSSGKSSKSKAEFTDEIKELARKAGKAAKKEEKPVAKQEPVACLPAVCKAL